MYLKHLGPGPENLHFATFYFIPCSFSIVCCCTTCMAHTQVIFRQQKGCPSPLAHWKQLAMFSHKSAKLSEYNQSGHTEKHSHVMSAELELYGKPLRTCDISILDLSFPRLSCASCFVSLSPLYYIFLCVHPHAVHAEWINRMALAQHCRDVVACHASKLQLLSAAEFTASAAARLSRASILSTSACKLWDLVLGCFLPILLCLLCCSTDHFYDTVYFNDMV